MCAPAAAIAVISAGAGIASSVGQHQSAQSAANASNQAALNNYDYQLKQRENEWQNTLSVWGQKRNQYKAEVYENFSAAQKGYSQEQVKLNEIFAKASFNNQDQLVKMVSQQGQGFAKGQSGVSATRNNGMMMAALGRQQAQTAASLASARSASETNKNNIKDQLASANNKAYGQVAFAPVAGVAPPAPVMQDGPNALSLIGGIGSSIASGMSAASSLSAPNPTAPTPTPAPAAPAATPSWTPPTNLFDNTNYLNYP